MKKDFNRIGATLCSSMRPRSATTSWLNKFKLLALVLMTLLSVNVWGETVTFTNKDWAPWTNITSGSSFESSSPARGVANNGVNGSCQSPSSFSNITKISVVASSNTTGGKVTIYIGDTKIGEQSISNSNNATYNYTPSSAMSGKVKLVVTKPSSKTVYVKSITITAAAATPVTSLNLYVAGQHSDLKSGKNVGDKYTLPTPAEVTAECGDKVLVGWSTVAIPTPGAKPSSNFYEPGDEVTLTTNNTFYAVFADAAGGGGSETKSYGFEDSDDETLWIIDGPAKESGNAHSGSKSGKINTANTYVQFKDKVKVTSFSYWFKRSTTNSNYNVYIETSTDGTNWEAVDTKAMSSFNNGSYAGSPVEKTFDGTKELYVRFHCYNTTAIRYVDDVSITYSGGTTYSNYTTSCGPSTYTLLFSELKLPIFTVFFKSFF